MLELSEITVKYYEEETVRQISMTVKRDEIVCLIGANGAGKSTVLKAVTGLVPVTRGRIIFDGTDVTRMPAHRRAFLGLGMVPEGRQITGNLNVLENLLIGAYSRRRTEGMKRVRQDLQQIFELFPVLASKKDQMGGTLSGGEQQMLAIGRGLMAKPKVLLLDEPSLGLAPLLVKEIFRTITKLGQAGHSVLLVEQNARMALKISDRGYVIENGLITLSGRGDELIDNEKVKTAYLGSAPNVG